MSDRGDHDRINSAERPSRLFEPRLEVVAVTSRLRHWHSLCSQFFLVFFPEEASILVLRFRRSTYAALRKSERKSIVTVSHSR